MRTGEPRADITAEFGTHPQVVRWLDEHALSQDGDSVMLRRVIDSSGRSRAFINGTPATLTQLREVGEMLVDIHGQHAHQLLMRPDAQRELFDTHAGLVDTAAAVNRAWRAWREAQQAVDAAQSRDRELQLERERLAWQLSEFDKLAPQSGEWEEVSAEHHRLSHSASLIDGVQNALGALSESDDAMISQLGAIISKLRSLADIDPALNDVLASLEPAEIQLQEAAYSLSHYAQRLELDPDRLAQVEKRMDQLHSTARKFRLQPEALPEEHETRRRQLAELDAAADLDALNAAAAKAKDAYLAEANVLSKARAKAAKSLSKAVTEGMQELSMAGGSFEVALVPLAEGGANGLEQIEFRVAGHAGVALRRSRRSRRAANWRVSASRSPSSRVPRARRRRSFSTKWTRASAAASRKSSGGSCINSGATVRCCASRTCRKWPRAGISIFRWRSRPTMRAAPSAP